MSPCVQDELNLLPESLRSVIIFADVMDSSYPEIDSFGGSELYTAFTPMDCLLRCS
jgi:hypothetical protein